jgi:shikimate kinase
VEGAPERVILWGFMASGKTAVGGAVARRLGWEHADLDAEIVRAEGREIAEIFATAGEPAFRAMELEATRRWVARPRLVLTPGGGWLTNPAVRPLIPPRTLTVWLQVSPEVVLARVAADAAGAERPLLRGADPLATVRRLLAEREPLYRSALLHVPTDVRTLDEIADQITSVVRAGRSGRIVTSPEQDGQSG